MPLLTRRGFTLSELMVSLLLLGIVAAAIYAALATNQRIYLVTGQRIDLQQNLRAAASILPAELRELDAADSDLVAMSGTSLTIRAMRQLGFLCVGPAWSDGGELALIVRQRPFFGARQSFAVGDSLLLYSDGDPATRDDDTWLRGQVTAASSEQCPDRDRARPGYRLALHLEHTEGHAGALGGIPHGSPVRGFTIVTYGLYQSPGDKQWYLGQALEGAPMQPLVGPLTGPHGLTFSYYDSSGAVTAATSAVREIEIRVRGRTATPVRETSGGMAHQSDSVVVRVALRNNPRCSRCP